MHRRTVLIIGVGLDEYKLAAPFLERDQFQVDRFPSAERALQLTAIVPVEVLIVRYPLRDMAMEEFLQVVRAPTSPCRQSSVLLLTEDANIDEANRYLGRGANRVVRLAEPEGHIRVAVGELLDVAPRKMTRVTVRLQIRMARQTEALVCQTANLSTSGMLLDTTCAYPRGTRLDFELRLPGDDRPCVGSAQLIRRTISSREGMSGIALRFESFGGDSRERLSAFLDRL